VETSNIYTPRTLNNKVLLFALKSILTPISDLNIRADAISFYNKIIGISFKEGFEKPGLLVIPNAFGKRNFKTAAY